MLLLFLGGGEDVLDAKTLAINSSKTRYTASVCDTKSNTDIHLQPCNSVLGDLEKILCLDTGLCLLAQGFFSRM